MLLFDKLFGVSAGPNKSSVEIYLVLFSCHWAIDNTIIPLTNRVRGPYCKLRTEFFPVDLWPKREARRP